jgi:hypothetical protein
LWWTARWDDGVKRELQFDEMETPVSDPIDIAHVIRSKYVTASDHFIASFLLGDLIRYVDEDARICAAVMQLHLSASEFRTLQAIVKDADYNSDPEMAEDICRRLWPHVEPL